MAIPTIEQVEESGANMDTITEEVKSSADTLVDQYGDTRQTMTGRENASNAAIDDFNQRGDDAILDIQQQADNIAYSVGFINVGLFSVQDIVGSNQETLTYALPGDVGEEWAVTSATYPYTPNTTSPYTDTAGGVWRNVTLEARKTVARSLNVKDAQVIYHDDTNTVLDAVLYIYDKSVSQITWGVPELNGSGETIISVTGNQLVTTAGTYTLISLTGRTFSFESVADMKLGKLSSGFGQVDWSTIASETVVPWLGYHTALDGGDNNGVLRRGPHTDDGGSIFSIDANTYIEANLKGKKINIRKFGATGEMGQDVHPIFANAWAYTYGRTFTTNGLPRKGGTIYFPDGSYEFMSRYTSTTDATNLDVFIGIEGESSERTHIVVNNQVGFLKWLKTNYGLFFTMKHISVIASYSTQNAGTHATSGIAVELAQATTGDRKYRHYQIDDVVIRSFDVTEPVHDHFTSGIDIVGGGRPIIQNLFISGIRTTLRQDSWIGLIGLDLTSVYGPEVKNSKIWGFEYALRYSSADDPGPEGGTFHDMTLDGLKGFTSETPSVKGEPGLDIQRVHCNCGQYGMFIKNRRFVNITDCLLYNETTASYGHYADIVFDSVSHSTIENIVTTFNTNTDRTGVRILGSVSNSTGNTISNAKFLAKGTAIDIGGPTVKDTDVVSPTFGDELTTHIQYSSGDALLPLTLSGIGSPEGVVTAPISSTYNRRDGSTGTSKYVKESVTAGNTGWVAK